MNTFVQKLVNGGEAAVKELIGEPENLNLEFKVKTDPDTFEFAREDKKNIAKALSGFSNADGGVIVLGVETQQRDQVDVAVKLSPITQIDRFKSEVRGRIDDLIRPENPNIGTHIIRCEEDPERGYLLIEIGKSENRPHMSVAPSDRRYYRRTFSQTLIMDHSLIRDLFMAPKEAVLTAIFRFSQRSGTGKKGRRIFNSHFEIYLHNIGRVMASMPYLRVLTRPMLNGQNVNNLAPSSSRPDGSRAFYGLRAVPESLNLI